MDFSENDPNVTRKRQYPHNIVSDIMGQRKKKVEPKRGVKIRFVRGTYEGEKGWINANKSSTVHNVFVIIDRGQASNEDANYATYVRKTSVLPDAGETPKNVFEMVVQEDAKVARYLMLFANACAEAGLEEADPDVLTTVKTFIDLAIGIQQGKKSSARYSEVALKVNAMKKKPNKRRGSNENICMDD